VLERLLDESYGNGVPDNMEGSVSALIGMVRAFEDNKKLSANVTTAVKERYFMEPGQLKEVVPGKKYDIAEGCDDVRKAILPIVFPDVGETLISGISMMERWKDDESLIPTILQGFNLPKQKADTAYELSQMQENAGKYIGQGIINNDEMLIEPEITEIYEYNMLYDPDESCKVNCKISAEGFTGFRNKLVRGEAIKQILAMVLSSEILLGEVKIAPHLGPIYESMGEDPDDYMLSEEEKQERAEQQRAQQEEMMAMEEKAKQDEFNMRLAEKQLDADNKSQAQDKDAANKSQENEDEFQRDVIKGAAGGK